MIWYSPFTQKMWEFMLRLNGPHLLLFADSGAPILKTPNILSDPVLRDAARLSQRYPPIARYGVFGVTTWPIGCDTPSPLSECFPLGEHAKWRCDTPHKRMSQRYLRDTL